MNPRTEYSNHLKLSVAYYYHYFFVVCFETPYCPKCGKFIDEDLEEEEY